MKTQGKKVGNKDRLLEDEDRDRNTAMEIDKKVNNDDKKEDEEARNRSMYLSECKINRKVESQVLDTMREKLNIMLLEGF